MDKDIINNALYTLASYDPGLQHFAELREATAKRYPKGHRLHLALDQALSCYLFTQCQDLYEATGVNLITDFHATDDMIKERLNEDQMTTVTRQAADLTEDPLILELCGYAMNLAGLSSWGTAPWTRLAGVIEWASNQQKTAVALLQS